MADEREEVGIKAGPTGVELNAKGLQLNSWMTFITLLIVMALAIGGFFTVREVDKMSVNLVEVLKDHNKATSSSTEALVAAQREATLAIKKQTCLNQYEIRDRQNQERFCDAMAR